MIPKIFHYIWVGERDLPEKTRDFIEKAKKIHRDYEFRLWTEKNLSFSESEFATNAYNKKMWAFVSDYCRFKILKEYGGIYLDTDMELFKSFGPLMENEGFAGYNKQGDYIYCGVIGAAPQHPLIKAVVTEYDTLAKSDVPTSPQMLTRVFKQEAKINFKIYPYYYFYPVDEGKTASQEEIEKSYATHHWDESWRSFVSLRRFLRRIGLIDIYHKLKKIKKDIGKRG